jgi:hypothetical protein
MTRPATPEAFATWSAIAARSAAVVLGMLAPSLIPVRAPVGEAWILAEDETACRADPLHAVLTVQPWRPLTPAERDAVVAEAKSLPIPGITQPIVVRWVPD